MNVLIVEDDETTLAFLVAELARAPGVAPTFARSRDGALQHLRSSTFDLIVLDLKIPTVDRALDADENHGLAVHSGIKNHSLGTPVVIFSAFGSMTLLKKLLAESEQHDVFGSGAPRAMTLFYEKSELKECLADVRAVVQECDTLARIEISFGTAPFNLTEGQQRVLRIFARKNGGTNIRVAVLGGGLSGARTCRIEVQDANAVTSCYAVAKLDEVKELEQESNAHTRFVSPAIKIAGFPHVIGFVRAGAGNQGGLFYGLAAEHDSSLYDALRTSSDTSRIVARLREMESTWLKGAIVKNISVGELRRPFINDSDFLRLADELPFDWKSVEELLVRVRFCCQHGDLHGLNVLLKNKTEPLLIDFAQVGVAPASIDPLVLELSLLFHPAFREVRGSWPNAKQAAKWNALDEYTAGCPVEAYVRQCREWAVDVEAGDRGIFATVYAFSVRQLKFADGNHELAIAVATCVAGRLLAR